MEPAKGAPPPPPTDLGTVARTLSKILRPRLSAARSVGGEYDVIRKPKLTRDFGGYSGSLSDCHGDSLQRAEAETKQQQRKSDASSSDREAMEFLLANLFASVSAVKAAYAQLQVAQYPYDPDSIESADAVVVAELRRISELKQCYLKNQVDPRTSRISLPALAAQLQELRNLIKTYKITIRKLKAELELKDAKIVALRAELLESQSKARALEAKLHPNRSLAAIDALHLSGLNPTHFLTALRFTYKSIRSFVHLMVKMMESAGWDLDAAAGSIQPDMLRRRIPGHRVFAFESYVCRRMFSGFSHQSFGLSSLEECSGWDRRQFFDDFTRLKSIALDQNPGCPPSPAAQLCRAKYLSLVHPKMESSFFGDLDHRETVGSGWGFPASEFFAGFAEMARRVWLLHCLFFSFKPETKRSIFQVRRRTRFSDVYMESVVAEEESSGGATTVGFTIEPGFRLGQTLIQCKVYLITDEPGLDGRS
ncbi:protein GRAVITROPIC IN THE LIGHT 1-like [Musa acuminata AAA Group]|uniref:protein GRAVITROPIC IN THE LIGHT 1-like n=1 Tax=Musa acuminata AAA Group TaxID=214697 RepID=UPI0031CEC4D5